MPHSISVAINQFESGDLTPKERDALYVLAKIVLGAVPIAFIKQGLTSEDARLVDEIRQLAFTGDEITHLEAVAAQGVIDDKAIQDLFNNGRNL